MSARPSDAGGGGAASADARSIAWEALRTAERRGLFVGPRLDELFRERSVSAQDRGLATELATGITRRRLTLDTLIAAHVQRSRERIEHDLWLLLQLGAYQLLFLAIPPHAALNETVELCRRQGQPRWSGFVNGVLRSLQRDLSDEQRSGPAADAVPYFDRHGDDPQVSLANADPVVRYRRLNHARFPSPEDHPAEYISQAFSLPLWLAERWLSRCGIDETVRCAAWFLTPGRSALRVNPLRSDRESRLADLQSAGIPAGPGSLDETIRLEGGVRIDVLPGFAAGLLTVQDESAMHAVDLLDPRPGQRVLDLCAAPGGKTTHIAERMRNEGTVIATDVQPERLARVMQAAARLGLTIIETHPVAADSSDVPAGSFDRILLDVPCSNTGVLGKRPEARWRISEDGIRELAALQSRLLGAAIARVAPGGRIVYSTCSIESDENELIVQGALAAHPELRLLEERRHQPGRPADGAYQARLELSGPAERQT